MKHIFLASAVLFLFACGNDKTSVVYPQLISEPDSIPAGYAGGCGVPTDASLEDVSKPTTVVGTGTAESCTGEAVIAAVSHGGVITFNCGKDPVRIVLATQAQVYNDSNPEVVIDGGGLVTLSGGGKNRILYVNACDKNLHWTTSHCDNQDLPHVTVQNISFIDGNASNDNAYDGGGAIWVRGGRFKMINTRFFNNHCQSTGPDVGGGAVRAFSQYNNLPVYVVNSTFGGKDSLGNVGSNGGALSSIGVNWGIYNSLFSYNKAIGNGGNPAKSGTPGGGSGGAIYNDGNSLSLHICGSLIEHNEVNAYGSAIFFIADDHVGTLHIEDSKIQSNTGGSWELIPGVSMFDDTKQEISNSTITR